MQSVSAELAAAIASPDRAYAVRVSVDWDDDGHGGEATIDDLSPLAGGLKLDRALVGDLPAEVSTIEGSAAAEATVDLVRGPGLTRTASIAVRDSSAAASTTAASLLATLGTPLTYQSGDYLVAVLSFSEPTAIVYPGVAWTVLDDTTDSTTLRQVIYGRFVDHQDEDEADGELDFGLDVACAWSLIAAAVGPTAQHQPGVAGLEVAGAVAESGTATAHVGPSTVTTRDGCVLLTAGSWRTGTSGTWSPPAGDTEVEDVRGTDGTLNIAATLAVSAQLAAGTYARSLTTSASTATAIVAVVAIAPVQATDERHGAGWYLSPAGDASAVSNKPTARRPATIDVGLQTSAGMQWVPRLRGYVRGIEAAGAARTATLTIADRREDLRRMISLPPIDGTIYGGSVTWAITWALMVCGWTPAPRPRELRETAESAATPEGLWMDTAAVLPCHGSLWPLGIQPVGEQDDGNFGGPEVYAYQATFGVETQVRPTFVPGPFVLGVFAGALSATAYTVIRGTLIRTVASLNPLGSDTVPQWAGRVEFWVRSDEFPDPSPLPDDAPHLVRVVLAESQDTSLVCGIAADGAVFLQIVDTAGPTVLANVATGEHLPQDADPTWYAVGIGWDFSVGAEDVYFRLAGADWDIDVATTITSGVDWGDFDFANSDYGLISYLPLADLHINASAPPPGVPWLVDSTVVDAHVDPSQLELDVWTERRRTEAWELFKQFRAAEQAVMFADEVGEFWYRTRARLLEPAAQDPVLTLTAEASIVDIRVAERIDSVRNHVEVGYAEAYAALDYVYTLADPVRIDPGAEVEFNVVLDDPVTWLDQVAVVSAVPGSVVSYVLCRLGIGDSDAVQTAGITAWVVELPDPGTATIHAENAGMNRVWITALQLAGRAIRTRPAAVATATTEEALTDPQPLTISASAWQQRAEVAQSLADQLLADLARPLVEIRSLSVRGDPRVQLGDRVTVLAEDAIQVGNDWWVVAVNGEGIEPGRGYVQDLAVRQALPVLATDADPGLDDAMLGG